MGIYSQPNSYECGPFALKHALLMIGVFTDERRLASLAGTTSGGTDETQLARAAQRFRCELPTVRRLDAQEARRSLGGELARGRPSLICVDQWEHWIAVVGEEGGRYVLLDSAMDAVVRVVGWDELDRMWAYRDSGGDGRAVRVYDLHPVIPRFEPPARATISVKHAEALLETNGRELARDWSKLARDLVDLAGAKRSTDDLFATRLDRVIAEERGRLIERVAGADPVERVAVSRALNQMRFVADAYDLRILMDRRRRLVDDVTDLLRRHAELRPELKGKRDGNGGRPGNGNGNGNGHSNGNGNGNGPGHDHGTGLFGTAVVPPVAVPHDPG
jgi:hypothetical protein